MSDGWLVTRGALKEKSDRTPAEGEE